MYFPSYPLNCFNLQKQHNIFTNTLKVFIVNNYEDTFVYGKWISLACLNPPYHVCYKKKIKPGTMVGYEFTEQQSNINARPAVSVQFSKDKDIGFLYFLNEQELQSSTVILKATEILQRSVPFNAPPSAPIS